MDNQTVIDALIGGAMPLIIAMINQSHWSPKLRGIVAFVACAGAAAITGWIRGDVNWTDWRQTFVVIMGAAIVSYTTWWKPTTIAPTVEAATTVSGPQIVD